MPPGLERLLARPSVLRLRRCCVFSCGTSSLNVPYQDCGPTRQSSAVAQVVSEGHDGSSSEQSKVGAAGSTKDRYPPVQVPSCNTAELELEHPSHDSLGRTSEVSRKRTRAPPEVHARVSEYDRDATKWSKVLEIVRHRRRHSRLYDAEMVFRKIIQNKLDMPTEGEIARELWDHFVQVSNRDSKSLLVVAEYAVRLRQRTGRAYSSFYNHLMNQRQVWRSPSLALSLHQILKTDFPPMPADYANLLRLSLNIGRKSLAILENIYNDHPVPHMYSIVVPKLCTQGLLKEATKWHYLLLENCDLPKSFHDCKPLLDYHARVKNDKAVEDLVLSLAQRQVWYEKDMDQFVQSASVVSREIMNRALGEAHGIAPKTLSDGFCARLLATRLFSVDLVISGLQAIGVTTLGSSSVRELVIRDDYSCSGVMYHFNKLQEAGISMHSSKYNMLVRKAAIGGQSELLKSIVDTDLHPDTFEDINLQERLLAMYCEKNDHAQMERTMAIIESTIPERSLKMQRANLLLRCHISLRNRAEVISILQSMQRNHYPLTPRSSRHLRRAYLTPRRTGARPIEHGQENQNLILIINVMKMTLQSGASIPLEAWREVLRRLGMMGHLAQYQNLALWLVDYYTGLPGSSPPRSFELPEVQHDGLFLSSTGLLSPPTPSWEPSYHVSPLVSMSNALIQHDNLHQLFGKQAQQGMIAWGFQAEVKRRPHLPQPQNLRLPNPRTHWQWGLRLLKQLQDRGVLVNTVTVAKACKLRLAQLFNHNIISNKTANRRAKELNDERSVLMAKYRYSAYVRGMEEIWGRDLFRSRSRTATAGQCTPHGPIKRKLRLRRRYKRVDLVSTMNKDTDETHTWIIDSG